LTLAKGIERAESLRKLRGLPQNGAKRFSSYASEEFTPQQWEAACKKYATLMDD